MSSLRLVASVSLLLGAASVYAACGDSKSSAPDSDNSGAGAPNGGDAAAPEAGAGGQNTVGGSAGETARGGAPVEEGGAGEGGTESSNGGADNTNGGSDSAHGGAPMVDPELPEGPCTYATSGGASLPPSDAQFICTNGNRVFQNNGAGDYDALFGAGFFTTGNDSSTLACSISSAVPPANGDTWTLSADHPGSCELSSQEGATTSLWKAGTSPASGAASISFESVTLTHGSSDPSDVYYLCTVKLSGTLVGETGAEDVSISGAFQIKMVPIGG